MQLALNLPNPLAARQALFLSTGGQPFTTSRAVAERFGKRHDTVLRAIQNLLADMPDQDFTHRNFAVSQCPDPGFTERNFALSEYRDRTGRSLPEYRLTHDGFALVVMGFTGRDALAWKVAFLQAFNALEAELAARTARYAAALDFVRPALRPVVEGTEQGLGRAAIAQPLGKTANAVTYHRNQARRLGLLRAGAVAS